MNSSSSSLLFINSNIFIISIVFILFTSNIDAIITNLSQQQLGKLEQCSNETYVCVKNSMDEQEIYCCCNHKWTNCRRKLSCEDIVSTSTTESRYQDDCRFLSTYERYFKRPKTKNCTILPDLQCNGSQKIMASFIGNGYNLLQFSLIIIIITIFINHSSVTASVIF